MPLLIPPPGWIDPHNWSNELATTDYANVLSFGADPFGNFSGNDSTQAIQNAINFLGAGGGTVYFPDGNYIVSSQLVINSSSILLSGSAFGFSSNLIYTGTNPVGAMILVGAVVKQTDVTIQNLTLRGGATSGVAYSCTSASPAVFTVTGNAPANGTQVELSGSGTPGGFSAGTIYFVVNSAGSTFQLAATSGGAAINSSTTGGGALVFGFSGHGIQWRCQGGLVQNVVVQKVVGDAFRSDPSTIAATTNDLTIFNMWPEFCGGNGIYLDTNTNDSVIYGVHANGDVLPALGGAYGINDNGNANQFIGCHPYAFGSGGYIATGNGAQYLGGELESCGGPNATFSGVLRGRINATLIYNAGTSQLAYTATNGGGISPAVFTVSVAPANNTNVWLPAAGIPTGFTANTIYWVQAATATTFQLSATAGGTSINSSSTGTGTLTAGPAFQRDILINASTGITVGDNHIRSPATIESITVQGVSTVVKIHDNVIDNTLLAHAIGLTSGGSTANVSISDNSFNIAASPTSAAIRLATATDCSVIGNKQVSNTLFITEANSGLAGNNVVMANDVINSAGNIIQLNGNNSAAVHNPGFNPQGKISAPPAVALSGTAVTNNTSVDCMIIVTLAAAATATSISIGGQATGITSSVASAVLPPVRVPAGQTITLTYSNAPTWVWFGD